MGNVKWLHISDIHMNKRGVDNRRMREKLIEYLSSNDMKCDYVFVTGDLRYAPEGTFASDTVRYLREICDAVGVTVDKLFIVPGNHDVDRDNKDRNQTIESICGMGGYYQFKNGVIHDEDIVKLKAGRDDFLEILKELYMDYPDRILMYTAQENIHFCVETKDFNIVHLDSTIAYTKDRQRDFIVGTEQLMNVLDGVNPDKVTILLSHYSSEFLHRSEQKVVVNLLIDYNVQLWIAGHEHDEMLRKQQDYYFEFQSGNLIYEGEGTQSCISIGEYDREKHNGAVKVYYWASPEGWALYPFSSKQTDRTQYKFELLDNKATQKQLETIVKSDNFKKISNEAYVFNLNDMNSKMARKLEKDGFLQIKSELGSRLVGNESDEEMMQMFLSEIKTSLNLQKRYDCMPMFKNMIRDVYECYLYLDGEFAPFTKAKVCQRYYNDTDTFEIYNDAFQLCVITVKNEVAYISFGYNLSKYSTVEERLLQFETIDKYLSSEKVFIKMVNHEQYNLSFDTALPSKEWSENIERTKFWINQMRCIALIENHYNIKFNLPLKASDDEYIAIEILSDSIEGKSSRILEALPMKHPGFRREFSLNEDVYIDNANSLPALNLFGYSFVPIAQYIMAGEYYWNKRKRGWERKDKIDGGIPIRVEFEISFDEDSNRELINRIPFKEVEDDFNDKEIVCITGEEADFFERYIKITHDFQEIWQLYLCYKNQLERMQEHDLINLKHVRKKSMTTQVVNKIVTNELTDNVVVAGKALIGHIEGLEKYVGNYDTESMEADNIAYAWLVVMEQFSSKGHFPISVDAEGVCYYNLLNIEYEVNNCGDKELTEFVLLCKNVYIDNGLDIKKISHYDVMRNYLLFVAQKLDSYFKIMKPLLSEYTENMKKRIYEHPELVMAEGRFKDHVVYLLNDEDEVHAFHKDGDVMMDYYKFSQEAANYLSDCMIGMNEEF